MKRTATVIILCVLLAAGGCIGGRIERPEGYLDIETGPYYQQRCLSVEDNVIATRLVENPDGGTLEFWTAAIEKTLVKEYGYALASKEPTKAGRVEGTLFDFRVTIGGEEHSYLIALYVQPKQIALVEAAGRSEQIARDRDKLVKAMRSIG